MRRGASLPGKVSVPRLSVNLSLSPGRSAAARGREPRSRARCQPCARSGTCCRPQPPQPKPLPRRWPRPVGCVVSLAVGPWPTCPPPCYGAIISSYPRALMNWLCSNCRDFFFKEGACSQSSSPARQGCTHPLCSIPHVRERESCVGFSWEIRVRAHSSSVPSPARCFLWFPSPTEDNGFCCSYSPWEAGAWEYTPNTSGLFFCLGFYFTVEVRVLALFCCWVFFKLLSLLLHTSFFWHRAATHQLFTIPSPFLFFSTTLPRHRLKVTFSSLQEASYAQWIHLIQILFSLSFPPWRKVISVLLM